jgi:hypothetical protein
VIVGRTWTWGHIPKTGGDATRAMVEALGLDEVAWTPAALREKHGPFGTHLDLAIAGDRIYAANIRRLPAWTISVLVHRRAFGWFAPDTRPRAVSIEEAIESGWADERLALLTNDGRMPVDRWLRTEMLASDLLRFLAEVEPVEVLERERRRQRLTNFPQVNAMTYDRDLRSWFTRAQVDALYAKNPQWLDIEDQFYGRVQAVAV